MGMICDLLRGDLVRGDLVRGGLIRGCIGGNHPTGTLFILAVGWTNANGTGLALTRNGTDWTPITNPLQAYGYPINGIAFSGSIWVAVGYQIGTSGRLMSSPDGINWTEQTSGVNTTFNAIMYGAGLFVVGGSNGIITSPDGVTWTFRSNPFGAAAVGRGAFNGSNLFVILANDGIATSPDGINWTTQTPPATTFFDVGHNGTDLWVLACSTSGTTYLATSLDGVNWTLRTSPFGSTNPTRVAYGGGQWVAGANSGAIATSPDGLNWTLRTTPFTSWIEAIAFDPSGLWIAADSGGTIAISSDAVTWTPVDGTFAPYEVTDIAVNQPLPA